MFSVGSLKSLKPYLWEYRRWMFFSLLMAIPLSALRVGPIPLVKYLMDEILDKKDASKLIWVPIGVIALYFLNLFIRFSHYYSIRIVVTNVNQKVREKLYRHLIHLSADHFTENKSGSLLSRITADPWNLDQGIAAINSLIREPITFLGLLGYVFYLNWKLTLLTLTITPLLAWVFQRTGKYLKIKINDYQVLNGEQYSTIQETISGIKIIHQFNLQDSVIRKFSDQMNAITGTLLKISKIEEFSSPMVELITSIAIALILYSGGKSVLDGEMTSGDLIAFFTSFGIMINLIRQFGDINSKLHSAASAMDRINEFLSWKSSIRNPESPIQPGDFQTIELRNIQFTYPGAPDRKILRNLSFSIPNGKTVALVGQSGSGKSSIAQLLTRIYDVDSISESSGIFVDGVDLRKLELNGWREKVAVVSQDVFLFHDTIFENIAMGKPGATREEVIHAAKQAYAYDFIMKLSQGLDTVVGDRGMKLSGGERQRISIARAFLKNSPFLILDEATSNLDQESEKIVQTTLESLMKNKTTLVIAHRISTIRNADTIHVIRNGELMESGSYDQLIQKNGEFSRLCQSSLS